MIRLEGPTLPRESLGAIPPVLFGDLLRDVPGIPVQVGWAATLADNCGIDALVLTLKLGGADLAEVLAAVPAAGVVQLENEWLQYRAIVRTAAAVELRLSARGYRDTVPAAHAKGTTVYFVETRPLYVLAYAPPGCSYPDDMLVQLRVNDNAETPPCVFRTGDTRLVPGVRLVTAEFDASRAFYQPPAPTLPAQVVVSEADLARARAHRDVFPLANWMPAGGRGPTRRAGGVATLQGITYPPPAPTIRAGPSPPAAPFAGGGLRTVSLRQGALGRVSADLRGLRDTGAGRYSGTGLAPLVAPAAIVRCLLEESYGETAWHEPTGAATAARHAALGYIWRLVWRGAPFEAFRAAAQACGQADLYLDDAERWRYGFRDPTRPAVLTLTPRELLEDPAIGWTAGRDVITELEVVWGDGLQGGTVTLESPAMITRHGRNHGGLELPYAAHEAMARTLGRYWLSRRDRPRQAVTLSAAPVTLGLTVTDRVYIDTPLLGLYGTTRVPFEVIGLTDRGHARVLALLEADPRGAITLLSGTLLGAGARALDLTGSVDLSAPQFLALTGTLLQAGLLTRTLAGTLELPGGLLTRTLTGTLVQPGLVTRTLAGTLELAGGVLTRALTGTLLQAGLVTRALTGTLVQPGSVTLGLTGTLEAAGPPPLALAWDQVDAVWDDGVSTWDPVIIPPPVVPTLDQVGTGTDAATPGTITIPLTLAADADYVVVDLAVFVWSGGTIPAPTVDGVPMTLLAGGGTVTQWLMLYRRYGLAVTGGATVSVVVTHSGGSQQAEAIARSFIGVASVGPTEHSYVFTGTPSTGSLTHADTPEALVVGAAHWRTSNVVDPVGGQTVDTGVVQHTQTHGRASHKVGSGTVVMQWDATYGGSPSTVEQLVLVSTPLLGS